MAGIETRDEDVGIAPGGRAGRTAMMARRQTAAGALAPRPAGEKALRPASVGSKAEVLADLLRGGFSIPPFHFFTVREWACDSTCVCHEVAARLRGARLAVRSSCRREDRADESMAGAFLSLLDVPPPPAPDFARAVEAVIRSYGDEAMDEDQVLVQAMVGPILLSGVVMTRDLDDGAPYYVVNYDDETGRTDTITGGDGPVSKTVRVFRGFRHTDFDSQRLLRILRSVRQVESHLGSTALDIEFCMDSAQNLRILQARPIGAARHWAGSNEEEVRDTVSGVEEYLAGISAPRGGVFGRRTILGVMPDWNPAEILGITPRPLACSLYRDLVTQRVWREAGAAIGYREMPPEELMVLLAGRPYIDVRNSFNSFLPREIDPDCGERLVDAWLDRLDAHPEFHDKVEFEIAQTVAAPGFRAEHLQRYPGVLEPGELDRYEAALTELTDRLIDPAPDGSLARAMQAIGRLRERQTGRAAVRGTGTALLLDVRNLLDECRALGTMPFAIAARHAFVAEAFLRGAMASGAISAESYHAFKGSIRTVSSAYGEDLEAVHEGRMDPRRFMERYGHLRPGTYDILSPRYADRPEEILGGAPPPRSGGRDLFELSPRESASLASLLRSSNLSDPDPARFLFYARQAIVAREEAKFVFTRDLSDALESLAAWGVGQELSREELSWLDVRELLDSLVRPWMAPARDWLQPRLESARHLCAVGRDLKLGYLLRSARDVYVVPMHRSAPNFVTRRQVRARVVDLEKAAGLPDSIEGAIVCVRNADPGHDWIFSRGIAGLVTQFGGTNSHMSIRCAEYGIPAAVGCGELLFERVRDARECELDAERKLLRPVGTP